MGDIRKRKTTLKATLDGEVTYLYPTTSGDQVFLDENTKLSPKIADMISAINLREKITDHNADVAALNESIDTKVADAIHNSDVKVSDMKTYVDENVATINTSMEASHTAINDSIEAANASIALRAKQADVDAAISNLSNSVDTKLADKASTEYVDTKVSDLKQEILGDLPVEAYDTFTELASYISEHQEVSDSLTEAIETKANKTDVDAALSLKANQTDVDTALAGKVNTSDLVDPGNGTITLKQGGEIKGSFSMNQDRNVEIVLDNNNPTYTTMVAASATEDGKGGLVPAPTAGKQSSFLRGDGTWATPADTKYTLESFGVSATADEINYIGGATSNIQVQLDSKVDSDEFYEAIANVDNSVTLTQAEYDALSDEEKARDITYYITDGGVQQNATAISFTSSVYDAKNVGDALNEVKNSVNEVNSNLSNKNGYIAYASNDSLENIIENNISNMKQFIEYTFHVDNISGTPFPSNNNVIVKVIITNDNKNSYNIEVADTTTSKKYYITKTNGTFGPWTTSIVDLDSNFSELGTGTFYGWCILRVQGGVGYLYITDTNIKSTDKIAFNENLEIVGVVYKQLSSIVVTNRNGGFLVTITFDGMDNYNNSLVGFEYTVSR